MMNASSRMISWIISHVDPQRLGFLFIASVDAIVYLLLLLFLADSLISHFLRKGFHQDRKPFHPDLKRALSFSALLAVSFTCTILLVGMDEAFSSWRFNLDSTFLVFNFLFHLLVAAIVTGRQFLTTGLNVFWAVNYFNITTIMYVPSSFSNAIFGQVVLPNDLLSLVTLPMSVILLIYVIQGNSGLVRADDFNEKGFVKAADFKEKGVIGDDVL